MAYLAPNLHRTGVVGVFAASSPFPEERYQVGAQTIRALGFEIRESSGLRDRDGYLAGSDSDRLAQLEELLADPEVDILWAARGGYGAHRIMEAASKLDLRRHRKPMVGFSDVTALHAIAQKQGLISYHGPVLTQLGELEEGGAEHTRRVVSGDWSVPYLATGPSIVAGRAEGPLIGGCLSVLAPLVGTPYLPDLSGAVLLLEDVGEASYRIDRLLTHLLLAGVFDQVSGVALGEFIGCKPRSEEEPDVDAVLLERLGRLDVPVLAGLPFGHGHRNLTVPLGARVELDASAATLQILETPL